MAAGWQKVQIPLMERLALADMAERQGKSDEQTLAEIIRDAVRRECAKSAGQKNTEKQEAEIVYA